MRAVHMRTDYLKEPVGLGNPTPRLYWKCEGGVTQSAYQVIAEKDGYAAIVEVKLRESADFAEAREFVTRSKQAKLRRAALHWLMTSGTELQPRFDVVEIYTGGREHIINHIENAFE